MNKIERQLERKAKELQRRGIRLAELEVEHANIRKPFARQINQLTEQMENASRAIEEQRAELSRKQTETEKLLDTLTRNVVMSRARHTVPSDLCFLDVAKYTEFFLFKTGREMYDLKIVRPPSLNGFVIKAASGWRDRVYFAWKKNRLVGIMVVSPSKLPGDATTADAIVHGKRHFHDDYEVKEPLAQFIKLLKKG